MSAEMQELLSWYGQYMEQEPWKSTRIYDYILYYMDPDLIFQAAFMWATEPN